MQQGSSEGLCCNYDIIIFYPEIQSDGWELAARHGKLATGHFSHNMNVSYFNTWILCDDGLRERGFTAQFLLMVYFITYFN